MTINRLTSPYGKLIDFNSPLKFTFEGKEISGFAGDTIASALLANNQKLISRSFKYHRPRGIFSMTGKDANTLVQLPEEGNVFADAHQITSGLQVKGQHYSGSLEKDRLSLISKVSRFMPVGFYYKAFYKFNSWDKLWCRFFRPLTGLGVISTEDSDKQYDKQFLFYDVVIVGGGLAGMLQAEALAKQSVRVLLVDDNSVLGGQALYTNNSESEQQQLSELVGRMDEQDNLDVMLDTTVNGIYTDNWLSMIKGNRMYKVRAKEVVFACGAYEQPLVFHNNDLPGIMLGSAAQKLIQLYAVKPGNKAVVAAVDELGYRLALDLKNAGVAVAAVVDLGSTKKNNELIQAVVKQNIEVIHNQVVYCANADSQGNLSSIELRGRKGDGIQGHGRVFECDLLCISGIHMPVYQLPCYQGAKLNYNIQRDCFQVTDVANKGHLVGAIDHVENIDDIQQQVNQVTHQVLVNLNKLPAGVQSPSTFTPSAMGYQTLSLPILEHPKGKEFVDFDEDLQIADIINAVREGYEHIQLVKRFSTLGMGPSQGRFSSFMSALLIAQRDQKGNPKEALAEVGVTTARPPFTVEKIGHQAGRSFFPERHSSIHHRHTEMGAQPLIAGAWIRPAYYGDVNQKEECVRKESLAVHNNVGIVDVSTLGGLEIRGPDAAEFVNRLYTWNFLKQPVGKARYALLTNETGVVIDDGVACRFAEQHFYVTATTGGVDNVYQQMLKWNTQWRLDVDIANATSAWCGVNLAGPNSRKVLQKVCQDVDLSAEAFPYVGVREGTVAGIPARLIRVGFVGELGYEIHVPQHMGEALWDALMKAGKDEGITPFGIETQRLLRLEKGHVIISQDTDSMTYPREIGMGWALGKQKSFFVGQKAIQIVDQNPLMRKLVGYEVLPSHASVATIEESHLCFSNSDNNTLIGRVTSCGYSAILEKYIGMAYVDPEFSENNTEFDIRCDNKKYVKVRTVSLPFYDPENKRQLVE